MKVKLLAVLLAVVFIECSHGAPRTIPDFNERVQQNMRGRLMNRIVGGIPADIKDFPHMLALLDLSYSGFICGASIISERWAITAAHCLYYRVSSNLINLRGGSSYHASGGIIFTTESYTLHPQYNHAMYEYDIAIIHTTATSLMKGTNIAAIPISNSCDSDCCDTCPPELTTVTGWGRDGSGSYPASLYQITLPIVDRYNCSIAWRGIYEMSFCIYNGNGKDSCSGDSGSPIITRNESQSLQVGIVSFGTSVCGDGSKPSVSTRIEMPEIRDWITLQSGI